MMRGYTPPSSRRSGGSDPQAVGEQGCYLPHQRVQTRSFGLDGRQECLTIGVGKLFVVVEDLCRCLNRGDPVQQFLFRSHVRTHALSSCESPLIGRPSGCWPVHRRASSLSGLCHPRLVVATACFQGAPLVAGTCKLHAFTPPIALPAAARIVSSRPELLIARARQRALFRGTDHVNGSKHAQLSNATRVGVPVQTTHDV
jgi:hypothetical protein